MANVEAVTGAVLDWVASMDPDASCALLLSLEEVAMLHVHFTAWQDALERSTVGTLDLGPIGEVRKKVEALLVKAGYGGDPRP